MKIVLVVDDTPSNVKVLRTLLTVNGYEVVTAADGQEAVEKARADSPDLGQAPSTEGWSRA